MKLFTCPPQAEASSSIHKYEAAQNFARAFVKKYPKDLPGRALAKGCGIHLPKLEV